MSGKISTRLNTNGLIFYVDVANSNSYKVLNLIDIGAGRTGTLNGTTFNGSNGGNLLLNGSSDYISFPLDANLKVSYVTIDCWVNPTSAGNIAPLFSTFDFGNYDLGLGSSGFALTWGNNTFGFYYTDAFGNNLKTSTIISNIMGQWSNIVFTYDGTNTTFYLNGSLLTTFVNSTSRIDWGSSNLTTANIGRKNTNAGYFPGKIASVKVYNRALTSSEILDSYNKFSKRFS